MTFTLSNLTYCIHQRPLIQNISLTFKPGIIYGILGPNGSGKSTLLKTISRILTPTQGQIYWQGQDLSNYSRLELSRLLSLVPQQPPLYFDFHVYQMVAMGRYPYGCRTRESDEFIKQALCQVNAWHLRNQLLSQLSGGERQRIYIARALVTQAPILLLDEPTSHLDLRHQLEIWQLLQGFAKEQKIVIVTIHDLFAAERFCDQLIILERGQCRATGPYQQVITPQLLEEIFGVTFHSNSGNFELKKLTEPFSG